MAGPTLYAAAGDTIGDVFTFRSGDGSAPTISGTPQFAVYDTDGTEIEAAANMTAVSGSRYSWSWALDDDEAAGTYSVIATLTADSVSAEVEIATVQVGTLQIVGAGATACTLTLHTSGAVDVAGASVWLTNDLAGTNVIAGTSTTNANGEVTFMLEVGTVLYRWATSPNYTFTNPSQFTVAAAVTFTDAVAVSGGSATTITTQMLVDRVRDLIAEETEDFFSDTEITVALNEGKRMLFADLDVLTGSSTISATSTTAVYALASDFGRFISMRYGTTAKLSPINEREAADYEAVYAGDTGQPEYFEPYVAASGHTQVRLHPTPDSAYTLSYRYYAMPPDLVVGGQAPSWSIEWAYIVCYYAASVMLEKDRRTAGAADKMGMFEARKRQYRIAFENRRPVALSHVESRDTRPGYRPQYSSKLTIP